MTDKPQIFCKKVTATFFLGFLIAVSPSWALAKGGDEQNEIVLLNDSAAAVEDSDPPLSKALTQFANEMEVDWEKKNADSSYVGPAVDKVTLQKQIDLLRKTVVEVGPYPLIIQGLEKMQGSLYGSLHGFVVGMDQADFLKIYPFRKVRDFRHVDMDDWLTYNDPLDDPFHRTVTFYFENQKLLKWIFDDRPEVVQEYLSEFCFYQEPSLIYEAVRNVLLKMPYEDFLSATRRERPMLFTEFYLEGTARFASSSEFIVNPEDPPCCKEGFTLVKLGMSLGLAKTPEPIEGVVAHEIAHRVLDSIRKGNVNCDAERAANHLIVKWGFKKEFKEASQLFGQKKGDPAGCQEAPHKTSQS